MKGGTVTESSQQSEVAKVLFDQSIDSANFILSSKSEKVNNRFSDDEQKTWSLARRKSTIIAIVFYFTYELMSIIAFIIVQDTVDRSEEAKTWETNYFSHCGKSMDKTYSMASASLYSCSYLTIGIFMYLFTLYRNKLLCCVKDPTSIPI